MKVFHAIKPIFSLPNIMPSKYKHPKFPEGYTHVANVGRVWDLDAAYRLTNSIERPWWENKFVERVGPPTRSTSVGDVIQDRHGNYWRVEDIGFTQISETGEEVPLKKTSNGQNI